VWSKYLNAPKFDSSNAYDVLTASKVPGAGTSAVKVKKKEEKADVEPVLDDWEKFEEG
jgi:hypothetical protein